MLVDLDLVDGPQVRGSRICIIGAGIAGLTLANSLSGLNASVSLLETGGLHDENNQHLNEIENAGVPHRGGMQGRFRVLGGASSRWGGQLLPFTPDVLQPTPQPKLPAWPIELDDIRRHYEDVESMLGTNHLPYTSELLLNYERSEPFRSDDVRLRFSKWAPSRRRNLSRTLGQACLASPNVTVYLHANVTRLEMKQGGVAVQSARVIGRSGAMHVFKADLFVLCTGTIEACRLLLTSDDLCTNGIGNEHDQVGRYFHDHLSVRAGSLAAATKKRLLRHFTPRVSGATVHTPKLEASAALRTREDLLSVMAHFPIEEAEGSVLGMARAALSRLQSDGFEPRALAALLQVSAHSLQVAPWLWSIYARRQRPISGDATIHLQIDCEQSPHPESRVSLSTKRDALGCPIPIVNWRVSEDERLTVQRYARVIGALFHQQGYGEIAWNAELWHEDDSWLKLTADSFHMMGGTRMGFSAGGSVVDPNLKVHGVGNLYVASCSVFPTGGSSNPTLTLMSLTLRLSEHVKAELQQVSNVESNRPAVLAASV